MTKVPVMAEQGESPTAPAHSGQPAPRADGDLLFRRARVLLGWLPEEVALRLLNSNDASRNPTDDQRSVAAAMREAVASRRPGLDQTDIVRSATGIPAEYVAKLRESSAAAPFFAEGWELALADLTRLASVQPTVFTDAAAARVAGVDPADLGQIAAITLPTDELPRPSFQFDGLRNQFVVVSRNPNLRIAGPFQAEAPNGGPPIFGFAATVSPSFLQVARYGGRYFLRDGYHRSIGLLGVGVTWAPVFVRDYAAFDDFLPQPLGMPQEAYLGDRPPVVADYDADAVAASVQLPARQKMVVIKAFEVEPHG